jgi:hypothetical protein
MKKALVLSLSLAVLVGVTTDADARSRKHAHHHGHHSVGSGVPAERQARYHSSRRHGGGVDADNECSVPAGAPPDAIPQRSSAIPTPAGGGFHPMEIQSCPPAAPAAMKAEAAAKPLRK